MPYAITVLQENKSGLRNEISIINERLGSLVPACERQVCLANVLVRVL